MRHALAVLSALALAALAAFAVTAQADDDVTQTICDAGNFACVVQVDADGVETTVCGDVVWEPGDVERYTVRDCLQDGGNICTYPWSTQQYCCGVQLGEPPPIG